jgi:hypothetical protein
MCSFVFLFCVRFCRGECMAFLDEKTLGAVEEAVKTWIAKKE